MRKDHVYHAYLNAAASDQTAEFIVPEAGTIIGVQFHVTQNVTGASPTDSTIFSQVTVGDPKSSYFTPANQFAELNLIAMVWEIHQRKADTNNMSVSVNHYTPCKYRVKAGDKITATLQASTGTSTLGFVLIQVI